MLLVSPLAAFLFQQVPENMRVGGGSSHSSLHPAVMALMILAMLLVALIPRRYASVPIVLFILLTPFGEQIYAGGVHLFATRILILWSWGILFAKARSKEGLLAGGFTIIDKLFLFWALFRALATNLEYLNQAAFINQCGFLWDSLGAYFLLRYLIRDEQDVRLVIKSFAVITSVLSVTMLGERIFGLNAFGYIGGHLTPFVRDGAIRAQGIFEGPIPAGTFAATLLCLFVWLAWRGNSKFFGFLGFTSALVMVVTSASSTPLLASLASFLAVMMWPLRRKMRIVRWGIVAALIGLQMVMKAPVWYVIAHVDLIAGNSGYHRAILIDFFVRHFSEWWLIGVKSTQSWGWDLWDQANQFVAEGENGGLATFICFVWMISRCFGRLGDSRKLLDGDKREALVWFLGGALFSHVVGFFGISYNDQTAFAWFTLLAMIAVVTARILETKPVTAAEAEPAIMVGRLSPVRPLASKSR